MRITHTPLLALALAAAVAACGGQQESAPAAPASPSAPAPTSAPTAAPTSPPATPAARMPLPSAGATLSGTITAPPPPATPTPVNMTTDMTCVEAHDGPVLPANATINPAGQVQWAFVYVKAGLDAYDIPPAEDVAVLDQKGCTYQPHVFGVQTNQTIEIHNSDQTLHNVHGLPNKPNKAFNIAHPNVPGLVHRKSFAHPDIMVHVKCDVHPWMHAYVGVLPHRFFGVTDAAGAYRIAGLPPGDYTIGVWHETLGERDFHITVTGDAAVTLDVTFGDAAG